MYYLSVLPPKQHTIPLIVSRQISIANVSPNLTDAQMHIRPIHNSVCACRHLHTNSFVSPPLNGTKIVVINFIHRRTVMVGSGRTFYFPSINVEKKVLCTKWCHLTCSMDIIVTKNHSEALHTPTVM